MIQHSSRKIPSPNQGEPFWRQATFKEGIHSLTITYDHQSQEKRFRVESNFGKTSMVSDYKPNEKDLAFDCFKRLLDTLHPN